MYYYVIKSDQIRRPGGEVVVLASVVIRGYGYTSVGGSTRGGFEPPTTLPPLGLSIQDDKRFLANFDYLACRNWEIRDMGK